VADDYGMSPRDLDSCKLASLLAMSRNKDDWNKRELEIDELAGLVKEIENGVNSYFNK